MYCNIRHFMNTLFLYSRSRGKLCVCSSLLSSLFATTTIQGAECGEGRTEEDCIAHFTMRRTRFSAANTPAHVYTHPLNNPREINIPHSRVCPPWIADFTRSCDMSDARNIVYLVSLLDTVVSNERAPAGYFPAISRPRRSPSGDSITSAIRSLTRLYLPSISRGEHILSIRPQIVTSFEIPPMRAERNVALFRGPGKSPLARRQ